MRRLAWRVRITHKIDILKKRNLHREAAILADKHSKLGVLEGSVWLETTSWPASLDNEAFALRPAPVAYHRHQMLIVRLTIVWKRMLKLLLLKIIMSKRIEDQRRGRAEGSILREGPCLC